METRRPEQRNAYSWGELSTSWAPGPILVTRIICLMLVSSGPRRKNAKCPRFTKETLRTYLESLTQLVGGDGWIRTHVSGFVCVAAFCPDWRGLPESPIPCRHPAMTTEPGRGACTPWLSQPAFRPQGLQLGAARHVLLHPLPDAQSAAHFPRHSRLAWQRPSCWNGALLLRFLSVPGLSDGLSPGSSLSAPSSGGTFLIVIGKRGADAPSQVVCEPLSAWEGLGSFYSQCGFLFCTSPVRSLIYYKDPFPELQDPNF